MISRRGFVHGMALAGLASALGYARDVLAADPPPETKRLRIGRTPSACNATQYVAEPLLLSEEFERIEYVTLGGGTGLPSVRALGSGSFDITLNFAGPLVVGLDEGAAITILAGIHPGCFELFCSERVATFSDLKGKTAAVLEPKSGQHIFLASILTSIGLDPNHDIHWAYQPATEAKQLLAQGKIDAFLGFPPDPQELRARKIGHVLLNSATDRPWSQYFCCMVAANKEFARKNPIATRRAVRALLKASELCAAEPERAAKAFLAQGHKMNPEHVLQAIRALPYGRWRDYNPEETVRFYALRLREAAMVRNAPQKLIAQGTDWRILNELKKELKA